MAGDGAEHSNECSYGDFTEATSLPSPRAIHYWPARSWRNINAFYIKRGSTATYSGTNWKKITKIVKKWLSRIHKIWSKIVGRLPSDGMHLTGGLEMSNGVILYNHLLMRYGHTHAQCLGELLRLLANISLLNPDPRTKKLETIRDFFDRASRMAREAREFPAMKFPIAGPLLKVMVLEGLRRSDKAKYGNQITQAYVDDLTNDIEHLQAAMETVEGLRAEKIRHEYAPTQLISGTVMMTTSGNPMDPSNNPHDACDVLGHVGHLNSQCRTKWGVRASPYRGRGGGRSGGRGRGDRGRGGGRGRGGRDKNCFIFQSGKTCPYGDRCKYEHNSSSSAKAYITANTYQAEADGETMGSVNVTRVERNPFGYIIHDEESSGNE
jgi:hypothetical protein